MKKGKYLSGVIAAAAFLSHSGLEQKVSAADAPPRINIEVTWDAPTSQPSEYEPAKYKLVITKNNGPESARYIDHVTWTNGTSTVKFENLEPSSVYTFKVCSVVRSKTTGKYEFSTFDGPITYTTGAIRLDDNDPPNITIDPYQKNILGQKLSLSGTLTDASHIKKFEISGDAVPGNIKYAAEGGYWSADVVLVKPGENNITLSAKDVHGNTNLQKISAYIDTGVDSDGDGLTDFLEKNFMGTNPNASDSDGDGMSDRLEITAGYDPKNNADVFRISRISFEKGIVRIQAPLKQEHLYQLQRSIDTGTTWQNIETKYFEGTEEGQLEEQENIDTATFIDSNPPVNHAIYRIIVDNWD